MSIPFFSIVIPTYNRSNLLRYAIGSMLRQTCQDFEIVISDNYSTDPTPKIAAEFADARIRYVRTPSRLNAADSFEFARQTARGKLVLLPGDDDSLIATALDRFQREHAATGSEFLFCSRAEYRDRSFPGSGRNTLECPAFQDTSRVVSVDEFVAPAFQWRPRFDWHPSAFVFGRELADKIARRCGRFFQSNGVEFCAWPLAAVFANYLVYIDTPLTICGRTGQSWGANMILGRSNKKQRQQLLTDFEGPYRFAPLKTFTACNHRAEGYLTAKHLAPDKLSRFEFNERAYLVGSMRELEAREARGIRARKEIEELRAYVTRVYPDLLWNIDGDSRVLREARQKSPWSRLRGALGDLGPRRMRDREAERRMARAALKQGGARVRSGQGWNGFRIAGDDFGFRDMLGCADFLERIVAQRPRETVRSADRRSSEIVTRQT